MKRELIMISVIIALVIIGHASTQNYTSNFFEEIENNLSELKEQILNTQNVQNASKQNGGNNESKKELIKEFEKIHKKWNDKYNILAYYSEHDELEKIGTQLAVINGYLEKEEYTHSSTEIDKTIFLLQHIRNKDNFRFINIF